ncbi:class I SAM-dependent methyltransferase [Nostoc sp. CHAB 5844]|nr:class I SAM-dependent methyltransferase [Nostoc sp. CHAB 5844]
MVQHTAANSIDLLTNIQTDIPIPSGSFRKILTKLPQPAKNLSLLDVGCGQGKYLPFFAPNSVGLELSETELQKCREKGLTVHKWSFTEPLPMELAGRQFDAVMLSHFLEHVFSPHTVLLEIRKYLKPEGLLIVHCPIVNPLTGISDKLARRYGWQRGFHGALFGDHINFFTATTLRYTCEMAGFKTLYLGSPYLPNSLAKLLLPFWPSTWLMCQKIDNYQYNHESCKSLDQQGNIVWRI